jgi:DNA-binding transcriptional ArsR family regulator
MTDENSTGLPIETTVGAAGSHATEAFALLGNETRLAILLALWEEHDPHASDNVVSFSEIFDRVEYEDPGSFSYHLQELEGQFIRQYADGEGYELRVPALRFIHAVIAGAGVQDETLEPTEIDQPCPFCDAPTAISYEEGLVIHVCTECEGVTTEETVSGYLSAVPFDPAGLSDRTPEDIRAASRVAAWRQTQIMFEGLCPACSGPVDSWLECCPDHDQNGICERCGTKFSVLARFQCQTCKNHNVSSPKALALFHPAMMAFYEDHGISTRVRADDPESVRRVFGLMDDHEVQIIAEEPLRATVTASVDNNEIRLTFDETATVASVRP